MVEKTCSNCKYFDRADKFIDDDGTRLKNTFGCRHSKLHFYYDALNAPTIAETCPNYKIKHKSKKSRNKFYHVH